VTIDESQLPSLIDELEPGQHDAVFSRMESVLNRRAAAEGPLAMTVPMLYMEAAKG
jgi:hypothetical protein